jgi:putative protease
VREKETGYELEIGNHFIMSPKDLCTLGILDKLIATGVDVLKIEGRSRSVEYVYSVVHSYRKAIDYINSGDYTKEKYNGLIEDVSKVYNREFSEGFLFGMPSKDTWARVDGNISKEKKEYVGKVVNYYTKSQIVYTNVESNDIVIGDKIFIQGPTTGLVETMLNEIRVNNLIVDNVKKGEATFYSSKKVRQNDLVFRVRKENEK